MKIVPLEVTQESLQLMKRIMKIGKLNIILLVEFVHLAAPGDLLICDDPTCERFFCTILEKSLDLCE